MTPARRNNLRRLLSPRHVAVIGGRDAEIVIGECRRIGFQGELWAVNPNRSTLGGIDCVPTVQDLPAAPDAVFLAVPPGAALSVVRDLAAMDAGGVVCFTAGFGDGGQEGGAADDELVKAAGELAVVGPNCYGLINYVDRVALWPFEHGGDCPGFGAAIITQSGMLSSDITMNQRSLPLAAMVSAGNQSILALEDYVSTLCEYPHVRAVGLHIEGIRDIPAFAGAVAKAHALGKPVVAMKTGKSEIGAALTVSHTGSMSGDYQMYQALFRRLGMIEVEHPAQLIEALKFLCISGQPRGNRVMGFTCSGGGATMLADFGERIGLRFPEPTRDSAAALAACLPSIATVSNPLDYTTPIWGDGAKTRPVFDAALVDDVDATVLIQDYPHPDIDDSKIYYQRDAQAFAAAAKAKNLPAAVCSMLPENMDITTRNALSEAGITPMQGLGDGLSALSAIVDASLNCPEIPNSRFIAVEPVGDVAVGKECDVKRDLAEAGLTVPAAQQVLHSHQVKDAAESIGFPLVLKYSGDKIQHKSDVGAVVLNLGSAMAAEQAAEIMYNNLAKLELTDDTDRFLLERQALPPVAELVLGIRVDRQFGLVMTLGSGGVLVELVGDVVTLVLPAARDEVVKAIAGLRVARLLTGFRGNDVVDMSMLVDTIFSLVQFCMDRQQELTELEVNPLFVYQDRVVIIDALAHYRKTP